MPTRKIASLLLDLLIFALAATGSLMAFGLGAGWAVARSALGRRNPIELARPAASRARSALRFIYGHSGLPQALAPLSARLRSIRTRWPK